MNNWEILREDGNAENREKERDALQPFLDEATQLAKDGFTTDYPWPGVIYQFGKPDELRRVSVTTWMFLIAHTRGYGLAHREIRQS